MRLRRNNLHKVYLKKHSIVLDDEANEIVTYEAESTEIMLNVQAAGGTVNAQIYGTRLPYIKSCKYQGEVLKEAINELDGICLNVANDREPDFKITAIQSFSTHLNVTLERIEQNVD